MTQSRQFRLIIEALLQNKPVFVKNTGVRVKVVKLEKHNKSRYFKMKSATCDVAFEETPTYKALSLMENYRYSDGVNTLGGQRNFISGSIKIINLSHRPFETKTSKALYDSKKS